MKHAPSAVRSIKKLDLLLVALTLLVAGGCIATYDEVASEKIKEPKIITLDGSRESWTFQIEKRLRQRGFKIKRMAVEKVSHEKVSETKTEIYNQASARYLLSLQGYAPNSRMFRCMAGGYVFDYINVELIDLQTNETILYYSDAGHSEGCFPLSGHIFESIAEVVDNAWE